MRITSDIALIASGASGFGLTDDLDCNVWAIRGEGGWLLFDTGAGLRLELIEARLAFCGIATDEVVAVLLTHAHADHSGGGRALAQLLPRAEFVAGTETAALLARGDDAAIGLDRARGRYYPANYRWVPPAITRVMAPGHTETMAGLTVTIVATPGHSADHCCFHIKGAGIDALVAGDALFAGGKVVLQDIADCSVTDTLQSIRTLGALSFDSFLPGHGSFSLHDGWRHVAAARTFADRGLPPPQF